MNEIESLERDDLIKYIEKSDKFKELSLDFGFVEKVNGLIENWEWEIVYRWLERLKNKTKENYLKLEEDLDKITFIHSLMINLVTLAETIKYTYIYNSTVYDDDRVNEFEQFDSIKKFLVLNKDSKEIWWDCNSWIMFLYNFFNEVIPDNDFDFKFLIQEGDNHWMMFLKNNIIEYMVERNTNSSLVAYWKPSDFEEYNFKYAKDYDEYIKSNDEISNDVDYIQYFNRDFLFQITKTWYVACVIYANDKNRGEKLIWRFWKKFWKILYFLLFSRYITNIDELNTIELVKDALIKKVPFYRRKKIKYVIDNLSEEKLKLIFDLK